MKHSDTYSTEIIEAITKLIKTETKNSVVAREIIADFKLDKNFDAVWKKVKSIRGGNTKIKNKAVQKENAADKPFVLSAWNDEGFMMDIDQYCNHYKLPRQDVKSYKLVSHTGTPYYNIQFKEYIGIEEISLETVIADIFKSRPTVAKIVFPTSQEITDRLVYTDVHIAMEASRDGLAQYASDWNEEELDIRIDMMINATIAEKRSNILFVDELGDYMDGWDAYTTRGGHKLPQNMTNEKAFDVGVRAKVKMAKVFAQHWDAVIFNNICEDNHSGSFGYIVNSAFKGIVDATLENVTVYNHRKFLNNYFIGKHCFVITHGKDSRNLKFGFKPHLDPKQVEKIDQYLKNEDIYKKAEFIEVTKGDSHQYLHDACGSDDFEYLNMMAFSPSSEWVQTNFKKGRSGFLIQHVHNNINRKDTTPFWF